MRALGTALLVLAGAALAPPSAAQTAAPHVCRLPVLDAPGDAAGDAPVAGKARTRVPCPEPTARFEVEYTGFPPAAEEAFRAAVETWSCRIASDVPIRVDARWDALDASTLGAAGPFLVRNFDGAPVGNTWYAAALADALAGRSLDGGFDIDAEFNSTFANWHFDPDAAPAPNEYDLYTVVLHELAHGLGFIGGLRVEDGVGYVGDPARADGPYIYDRYTEDASGSPLLALPAPSSTLADALLRDVRFDGPATRRVGGGPLELHAPPRWEPGGSYSHLDEGAFGRGTPDGLMSPFIGRGEAIDRPGPAVCAVLSDLGWQLAGECAGAVGPVAPPVGGLAMVLRSRNPARRTLDLALTAPVPQLARVTLVDPLGRRVAALFSGVVGPDDGVRVQFDTRGVAAGSYLVVAEAEGKRLALGVTVVR